MDPICFHAKRVNSTFLALVHVAKNEEDADLREEALERISKWPKTHTFCIQNDEDALRVTWSKAFTGDYETKADTFSKKEGRKVALEKMNRFIANPPRTMYDLDAYNAAKKDAYEKAGEPFVAETLNSFLYEHLPAQIAKSLPWYIDKAVRYYKIDDNKKVIIEGSIEREDDFDRRSRAAIVVYTEKLRELI